MADHLELCVADIGAWRQWLDEHHARSSGHGPAGAGTPRMPVLPKRKYQLISLPR